LVNMVEASCAIKGLCALALRKAINTIFFILAVVLNVWNKGGTH
jgi:hypothetical protein